MPPLLFVSNHGLDSFADDTDSNAVTGYLRFQHDSGTSKGTINLGGATGGGGGLFINNVLTPTDASHAVNKQYVDDRVNGLSVKGPVKAATPYSGSVLDQHQASDVDQHHTGEHNVDLASLYVGSPYLISTGIDGVTDWQVGNRVLLLDQVNCVENGIWVVGATASDLERPLDFLDGSTAGGAYAFVDQGTHNADRSFVCVSDSGGDVVGTNDLHWHQYSRRPEALAGAGLKVSGDEANALDVRTDTFVVGGTDGTVASGGTLEVVDDQVRIRGGTANAVLGDKMNTLTKDNTFTSVSGSTGTTTGAVTVTGGVGIGENLHVGGRQSINSANAAGALGGAALSVLGGADIAMDVHIKSTNNLVAGGALTVAGAVQVDLEMQVDGHITTPYTEVTNAWATTTIDGVPYPMQHDPTIETQLTRAVNREYLRNTLRAHQWKQSAVVASTGNVGLSGEIVATVGLEAPSVVQANSHEAFDPPDYIGDGRPIYASYQAVPFFYTVDRYDPAKLYDGLGYTSIVHGHKNEHGENHDGVDHAGFRRRVQLRGSDCPLSQLPYARFNYDMGDASVFRGINYSPTIMTPYGGTIHSITVFGSNDPFVMAHTDATFTEDGIAPAFRNMPSHKHRAVSVSSGVRLLEIRDLACHGQYWYDGDFAGQYTITANTDHTYSVVQSNNGTPYDSVHGLNANNPLTPRIAYPTSPVVHTETYRYITIVYALYHTSTGSDANPTTNIPLELTELSVNMQSGQNSPHLTVGVAIDGTVLSAGNRVLLKDQHDPIENGLYVLGGSPGDPAVRAPDMNTGFAAHGAVTVVTRGAINADRAFLVTSDIGSDIVGQNNLQFSMLGQSPSQLAGTSGTGLQTIETASGTNLAIAVDNLTMELTDPENTLQIKGGLPNAMLGDKENDFNEINRFHSATPSTSSDTGALVVTNGGVGIGGDLHLGGYSVIESTRTLAQGAALTVTGGVEVGGDMHIDATTPSSGYTTGALVVDGGVGAAGDLFVGGHGAFESTNLAADVDPCLKVLGGVYVAQDMVVDSTTNSLGATTGAVVVAGGVGVGQDVHVGGTSTSTSPTTGALTVAGGAAIGEHLHVQDTARVWGTVPSTSSDTGTLIVDGGVGIKESLCVAVNATVTQRVDVGSTAQLDAVGGAALTVQGSIAAVQQIRASASGVARAGGDTGPDAALQVAAGGLNVAEDVYVRSTKDLAAADGPALDVLGGARIAMPTQIGTTATAEAAVNQATGSLRVVGGVGVTGSVHCTGVLNYSDQRLKANVESLGPEALDRVNRMNGCTFNWIATGAPDVGVIAQNILTEAPHCVSDQSEFLSVNYGKLVPYLIEGIKELTSQVTTLQTEMRSLKRQPSSEEDALRSVKRPRHDSSVSAVAREV